MVLRDEVLESAVPSCVAVVGFDCESGVCGYFWEGELYICNCPSGDYQGMIKTRLALYDPSTRVVAKMSVERRLICGVVV